MPRQTSFPFKFLCGVAFAFLCLHPAGLRGDKSAHIRAAPRKQLRPIVPQPRLLAQPPRKAHHPRPAGSVASPKGPDDPTDPFIAAQAAALDYQPNQIFAFVRDQIRFEAYPGALRGARGALWAGAGNTIDKAALLAAMLQASGYTTQYKHTTPTNTQAGQAALENLLRGMFPPTPVLLGCLPANAIADDPAGNGAASNWANDYFWVEYGPSNIDLDPNIPGGQPGQTIQAADATYATIPVAEWQPVTVKINVEQYNQASALFGLGPFTTTVLSQSFYTWELVGNIVSAGNIVQSTPAGGLDLAAITFTYTPYLFIGSGGPDVTQDTIVTGTDYQELYSNFPLSNSIVTGIFVEVDANDAWQEQSQSYTHTLFDRLGPAVRQGNAAAQVVLPPTPAPAVTDFDIATLNILPTRLNLNTFQAQQTRLHNAYQNYHAAQAAFQALPTTGTLTPAQQLVAQQAATLSKYVIIAENEMATMAYDGAADRLASQLDTGYYARIYPSAPRITVVHSSLDSSGNPLFYLDVLKNDMFVIDGYGQNRNVTNTNYTGYEEVARGMIESTMEANILSQVTGAATAIDIGTVMGALGDPNQMIALGPQYPYSLGGSLSLSSTTLSADAQTLILNAVQNGSQVLAPNRMVTVNGVTTVGWWETDQYGHTVSHFPNGNHQAIGEYAGANDFAQAFNAPIARFIGQVEGIAVTGYAFAGAILEAVNQNAAFSDILKAAKNGVGGVSVSSPLADYYKNLNDILEKLDESLPKPDPLGTSLIDEFSEGLSQGIEFAQNWLKANLPSDPPVSVFLTTPLGPLPAGVTPGNTPGVAVTFATDPIYTYPYNGNQLPVYDAFIINTGPATDTFRLSASDTSGHFNVSPSVNSLTLQPGQQGEVNVCAVPSDASGVTLPAVGAAGQFQLTATSPTSNATAQGSTGYTVPAIPVLSLTVDPQVLTVLPGQSVNATLILGSLGNASPGSVSVTAAADANISIQGLTSPVAVPQTGAVTQAVSFTAAANAPTNVYYVVLTASYTAGGGTQTRSFSVPVTVQTLGACSLNAALYANQAGMAGLGTILAQLDTDMNSAAASPANPAFAARIAIDLTTIVNSMNNVSYLPSFVPAITAAGNAVAAATPATLVAALDNLDAAICPAGNAISQASSYNTQIYLNPNSQVTGPNQAATFSLVLNNPSNTMKVYNLSVTGVPNGVAAQFNVSSVTLGPSGSQTGNSNGLATPPILTLTPGASFTAPFTFNVVATPVGAPEFAISAPGSLLVRPQQISIDNLTATPAYGPAGTQFAITARVFAEVNENIPAYLSLTVTNSGGQTVYGPVNSAQFTLGPASPLQTITVATIDSTGYANGPYTLAVQAFNLAVDQFLAGATASGSFLVGAPLSGTLTANANSTPPATVPPGTSAVQVALNITRDTSVQNPVSSLVGTAAMSGIPRTMVLYQNGAQQLAYVCSDSVINIVDVTNPAKPTAAGTFGGSLLTAENSSSVPGFQTVGCIVYNHNLIVSYSRYDGNVTSQPIPTHFATFSLANPLSPSQVGSVVDINRGDSAGLFVAGNTALLYQTTTTYEACCATIISEFGDVWTGDLTNVPANGVIAYLNDIYPCGTFSGGVCSDVTNVPAATGSPGNCTANGTTPIPNDQTRGGPYRIAGGTAINNTTTYFASTNANQGDVANPSCPQISGQLLVVDTTTPSAPAILTSVPDPAMAFMTGIAVQGNIAVAVGDSRGVLNIDTGYVGTLVVSSFDISNPRSPVLLNSVTTQLADTAGSFIVPLGTNTFAVGNTTLNGKAELVLVDASVPTALRYVPYDAAFVANPAIAQNNYFFALSSTPASTVNSLSVFQLSEITGPQLTVKLQLPAANCQNNTFNPAPTSCTAGRSSDTYQWNQPLPDTISFTVNVAGVNPGDVPTVVYGGEMDYTLPSLGAGTYVLPPLTVLCQQILNISPASQNVQYAGNSANFTVTVSNPTGAAQTFTPSTLGIPSSWTVQQPASVNVPAGGSQQYTLVLTTPLNAVPANYNFFAVVTTAGGITASVGGSLYVISQPPTGGGNPNSTAISFTASLNPSSITIGQNGLAAFQILITNTGNQAVRISVNPSPTFQGTNAYNGWSLAYMPTASPLVAPGLGNTYTVTGALSLPGANANTTAPGTYPIVIQLQSDTGVVNLPLSVTIVNAGVTASVSPGSGTPSTNYGVTLTNAGIVSDSYNLSIEGPLAQAAAIQSTVGPIVSGGASQALPITMHAVDFLSPGDYTLQVKAVSQANSAVSAHATATVTVSGGKGVSAAINPSPLRVSTASGPGSASLLFQATNTGNVPDTYMATITSVTGPVTATLNGGQSIASFPIPALGNSVFPLNATVTGAGTAAVTVKVTSLSDSSVTASATLSINPANACDIDNNGQVNATDVQLLINEALGLGQPKDDLNLDGVVNVVDIEIDISAALNNGVCQASVGALSTATSRLRRQRTVSLAAVSTGSIPIAGPSYRLTDLGTLGGSFAAARGINNLDQVVGESDTGRLPDRRVLHAFLWEAGRMTDLGPADRDSIVYAINDSGQAAGVYFDPDKHTAAFRYAGGTATPLSPDSKAEAINNTGQVVGVSAAGAFLWNSGTVTYLGGLGGSGGQASAINDLGQIAGSAYLSGNSAMHAFLYSGAALTDLGTLGGTNSVAFGINSAGQVVGWSETTGNGARHAFLYSGWSMTDLGTLGGKNSQADAVNRDGSIVGWAMTSAGEQHAVLWKSGQIVDLNSLVSLASNAVLVEATAINDAGQIAANGSNGRAYLITGAAPADTISSGVRGAPR